MDVIVSLRKYQDLPYALAADPHHVVSYQSLELIGSSVQSDDMDAARTIRRQDVLALDQFLQQQRAGHAVTVTPTSASSAATPGDFCSSVLATLAEVPREFDEVSKGTVTSASPAAGTQKTALEPVAAPPDLSIWSETLLVMPGVFYMPWHSGVRIALTTVVWTMLISNRAYVVSKSRSGKVHRL